MYQAVANESYECGLKEGLDRADKMLENKIIQLTEVKGDIEKTRQAMLLQDLRNEITRELAKLGR